MKVLVACEFSAIVRDAFRARGHDAWSCDIRPTEGNPAYHIQDDVLRVIGGGWDMMVAHPPCTYLTAAGNRWLYEDSTICTAEERLRRREDALEFFSTLQRAHIPRIAIENPEPHPYVIGRIGPYQDKIQPWMFGDAEQKGICLWLKKLPPLISTIIESKREQRVWLMGPGEEREKKRSEFFPGVAAAMADQWGSLRW